jgi:hypothetical protein
MHGAYHISIVLVTVWQGRRRWSRCTSATVSVSVFVFLVAKFGTTQWKVVKSGGLGPRR